MRKVFIILGLIAALLAVILSVLPLSNLAFIPAILALLFGIIALYLSNKSGASKKIIYYIFLLTIISLVFATYKSIFSEPEVVNMEELQEKENESKQEAIDELEELNIDAEDLEDINLEE